MKRLILLAAFVAMPVLVIAGCTWHRTSSKNGPPDEKTAAAVSDSQGRSQTQVQTQPDTPSPGEAITAKSDKFKASTDAGRDIMADITAPPTPIFKRRDYGELVQVSFTRVGGDNDVSLSPTDDLIAFSSDRHSADRNIYLKSITGSTVTQKTFAPFDEIQPAFSPDGRHIAYASNKNGNYDIWILDTFINGSAIQVTSNDEDDLHPSWSPDGESIVYCSFSSRTGDWSIIQTSLKTGEVKDLGPGKFPEVSPDGRKILFQRARQRDGFWYSIWTMNLDGTEQTEIVASPDWAAINPSWSPDGQFVAFASVNKSPEAKIEDRVWRGDDIYVVGVNGRGLVQITSDSAPDWEPCWSRRDGKIYFVSERNGFRNIWSVKPPFYSVAANAPLAAAPAAVPAAGAPVAAP